MARREGCAAPVLLLVVAPVLAQAGSIDTLEVASVASTEYGEVLQLDPVLTVLPFSGERNVQLVLKDDSPEDLRDGAALFLVELAVTALDGRQVSNRLEMPVVDDTAGPPLEFLPTVWGGFVHALGGDICRSADGREHIILTYEFDGAGYRAAAWPRPAQIAETRFRLLVANDYRIDLVLDGRTVATFGAVGNVMDGSNRTFVEITARPSDATAVTGLGWARLKVGAR